MTPTVKTFNTGFVEAIEQTYPIEVLETLLRDRTTGKNIVWADDEYKELGEGYLGADEITLEKITGTNSGVIKPRIAKEHERQSLRTKSRAEVFTPSWLCNRMNNHFDEEWFGRPDVFNIQEDHEWTPTKRVTSFPRRKGFSWKDYVCALRLEITCGEAPFICSRYDTVSGELLPVKARIGFLDRKLRVVTEKSKTYEEWYEWALRALQSTYGYEYQGDNLIIARINVLETFFEHMVDRWDKGPTNEESARVAEIISWNIWQMDGLTGTVPSDKPVDAKQAKILELNEHPAEQMMLFDFGDESEGKETSAEFSQIFNWEANELFTYISLKSRGGCSMKKFYGVIGNPPYQETVAGTSDKPIYNYFMDEAYKTAYKVELITPGRFLFDAGKTPKAWNRQMLDNPQFKVLIYKQSSGDVFPNTDIKGGVAVSYYDSTAQFAPIGVFSQFEELRTLKEKVSSKANEFISEYVFAPESYKFTPKLHNEYPEIKYVDKKHGILSKGHDYDLTTNIFEKLNGIIFFDSKPDDEFNYIRILGRESNERVLKYVKADYIETHENLKNWKVVLPKSNGSGAIGEVLSTPLVGEPLVGHTQSFISIGSLEYKEEAEALLKYIKTKFARALLGILKVTQDNKKAVWRFVPLQDFTADSDIDWSKSTPEIDQQLYTKYGLDEKEISFIESHVKEMN